MTAPKNIVEENKAKMSAIPLDLLRDYLLPAYAEGWVKYYRESWRGGFKTSDMFDALQRHSTKYFYELENYDQETWERYKLKKKHLSAMLFCVLCMCDTDKNHPELDDRESIFNGKIKKREQVRKGYLQKIIDVVFPQRARRYLLENCWKWRSRNSKDETRQNDSGQCR
jgi:hypothetical protein